MAFFGSFQRRGRVPSSSQVTSADTKTLLASWDCSWTLRASWTWWSWRWSSGRRASPCTCGCGGRREGLGSAVGIGLLRARRSRYLRWLHLGCIAQQYSCYCSFCGYYHHYEDYQHFHYHYCNHCHYLITDIIIIIIAAISITIIIIIIIINILFTHSSSETISFMSVLIFPPSTQPTNLSRCEYSRSFHHNSDSRGLNGLHDGFRDLLGQPLLDCGLRRKSVRGIFVW